MSFMDADSRETTAVLLDNVRVASQSQPQMPWVALAPFAALLVRLSEEASATAEKNLRTQEFIKLVTVVVLVISVTQLLAAVFQFRVIL